MNQLTPRAKNVLDLAKDIAREYGQGYVGTEHLLLAIIREGTGLGAKALAAEGVSEEAASEVIAESIKDRLHETWVMGRLPGTPHFRDVLSRAAHEARGQGNWLIGSAHILLALLAEEDAIGAQALVTLGVSQEAIRKRLRGVTVSLEDGK
jgi:ATP-dependent Clp protease ATP-binding subunit ClpC